MVRWSRTTCRPPASRQRGAPNGRAPGRETRGSPAAPPRSRGAMANDAAAGWWKGKFEESRNGRAAGCDSHVGHYSWRDFLHQPNDNLPPAESPQESSWQTAYAQEHAPVRLGDVPKNKASRAIVKDGVFDKIANKPEVQYAGIEPFMKVRARQGNEDPGREARLAARAAHTTITHHSREHHKTAPPQENMEKRGSVEPKHEAKHPRSQIVLG